MHQGTRDSTIMMSKSRMSCAVRLLEWNYAIHMFRRALSMIITTGGKEA